MDLVAVRHDWPTYLDTVDRTLDRFDDDPSVFGDELRMPDEIFVDPPLGPLPVALRDRARATQERLDRAAELVQSVISCVADRLGENEAARRADHTDRANTPAVFIDQKF